jgi:hypothetical protein
MNHEEFDNYEKFTIQFITSRLKSVDNEIAHIEAHLKDLKKQRKDAFDLQEIYEGAFSYRAENRWCHYSNEVLGANRIKKLRESGYETSVEQLDSLVIVAKLEAEKLIYELSTTLPEALLSVGLPVDETSRFPKFSVRESYIRIQVNEKSMTAIVTPSNGKSIEVNADVSSIVKVLVEEDQRLFNKDFNAEEFVKCLVTTISSTRDAQRGTSHSSISWKEILKNWRGAKITADELGAQLGMTMINFHQSLTDNGIFFNQEKGSENSLKPYGQTLLVGTVEIRNADRHA